MSFDTALSLTLLVALFVVVCTMANLLARITRLERFAQEVLSAGAPAPVRLTGVAVPDELKALTNGRPEAGLLFVSPECPACDEAIDLVGHWPEPVRRSTYLLYKGEPAADFVAPAGVRVVPGAEATFRTLSVRATPAFLRVRDGVIAERSTGLPGEPGEPRAEDLDGTRR